VVRSEYYESHDTSTEMDNGWIGSNVL